jgi:hypothetical protein
MTPACWSNLTWMFRSCGSLSVPQTDPSTVKFLFEEGASE